MRNAPVGAHHTRLLCAAPIKTLGVALAGLALCDCAARPVALTATAPAGRAAEVQCHVETVTGSLFKQRVCLTKLERDKRQGVIDDMKSGLDRQRSIACPNGSTPPCK